MSEAAANDKPIEPTPTAQDPTGMATDAQLEQMQIEMFGRKEEKKEKVKEISPSEKIETNGAKPDRAKELFEKTSQLDKDLNDDESKNAKENEDEGSGSQDDDFTGGPSVTDFSRFLEGDDDDPDATASEDSAKEGVSKDDPDISKEENLKSLRKIAGTFKQERNDAQAKIQELEQQLASRPDHTALQGKIQKLEARVNELEPYELTFGLHNNPEFKARFVDGAKVLVEEMEQIVRDYGVDESVVTELIEATNRKDIDDILSGSFASTEARSDLKILKQKHDGLQRERRDFEQKPAEALSKFQESQAELKAERNKKRDARFQEVSTSAWAAALSANQELPPDQQIPELIEIPGKKAHNEKVARPTLGQARGLVEAGLGHIEKMIRNEASIDPNFASWFASICQQAAATQMINYTRSGLHKKYQEMEKQLEQDNSRNYPGVNTAPRGASSSSSSGEKVSGKARAAAIFQEVMADN